METRDLVSWNSIVSAYEQAGEPSTALYLFGEMRKNSFQPDKLTFVSLASVAAQCGSFQNGRAMHGSATRRGWILEDIFVGNALIDMYAKLGRIDYAQKMFHTMAVKDVISWNTLITGYAQNGLANEAIELYHSMDKCEGIMADRSGDTGKYSACFLSCRSPGTREENPWAIYPNWFALGCICGYLSYRHVCKMWEAR